MDKLLLAKVLTATMLLGMLQPALAASARRKVDIISINGSSDGMSYQADSTLGPVSMLQ